jgi:hypothetical protein
MAYVQIPKDLTRVKTKWLLGLTKRQFFCFGTAALIGVPTYFFTRGAIGNSSAILLMMGMMLPAFFMAMYEKDGLTAEKILFNIIRSCWFFPQKRPYKTDNFYTQIEKEARLFESETTAGAATAAPTAKRTTAKGKQKGRKGKDTGQKSSPSQERH